MKRVSVLQQGDGAVIHVEKLAGEAISSLEALANGVRPIGAVRSEDATGGIVGSVTEALMGITAGLVRVADSLSEIAEAIRETKRGEEKAP